MKIRTIVQVILVSFPVIAAQAFADDHDNGVRHYLSLGTI